MSRHDVPMYEPAGPAMRLEVNPGDTGGLPPRASAYAGVGDSTVVSRGRR
jgi:hypothetical protein